MKRKFLIFFLGFTGIFLSSQKLPAQVIVKIKPVPPQVQMHAPPKPGSDFVLIPGHWLWSRTEKIYIWIEPTWTKSKEDKKWVPGHWKELPKGWKWEPGYWAKTDKRHYFII